MDQILEEVKGAISTADDITIHDCTEEEHDAWLCHLMWSACKYGLLFIADKYALKAESVMFLYASMIAMDMS